jgi:hypothetical protein
MNEFIYIRENSLSPDFCDELVCAFERNKELQYHGVMGNQFQVNKDIKETIDLYLDDDFQKSNTIDSPRILEKLNTELQASLRNYYSYLDPKNNIYHFDHIHKNPIFSKFLIHKYYKNEGKYKYHNDSFIDPSDNKYRVLNFLWYLNDVVEGGETEFFGNFRIKPEKGKLVIFPSEWLFPHTGIMPISNDKYVLCGWMYLHY